MTNTTFNVGDKVQTITTVQILFDDVLLVYESGTQGTVIRVAVGKLATYITIELESGKQLAMKDSDFELVNAPVASEPTAEAAKPAHRFPVGAVVAWTMERDTEKREEVGTIRKHYITMSGKLQYSLKIRSYSVLAYEHELRAL